jgi:transcriptional regulator with XRE-family HTH domain
LQQLVAGRLAELDLSFRRAADLTKTGGTTARGEEERLVSAARLNQIATGKVGKVSPEILEGIAKALDLPLSRVQRAAGVPVGQAEFRLPKAANQLTPRQRKVVLDLIKSYLEDTE